MSASTTSWTTYESNEYFDELSRRLLRNVEFRRRCEEWEALPIEDKRKRAAEILAELP